MTRAPAMIPIAVPALPASGRNVVPGMTNAPQPTLHPNASAHAPGADR